MILTVYTHTAANLAWFSLSCLAGCAQIAAILKCFTMGEELVRTAAMLFTRAADLEEAIDVLTSTMQVGSWSALWERNWENCAAVGNCWL